MDLGQTSMTSNCQHRSALVGRFATKINMIVVPPVVMSRDLHPATNVLADGNPVGMIPAHQTIETKSCKNLGSKKMLIDKNDSDFSGNLQKCIGFALLILFVVALPLAARSAAPREIWWAPQNGVSLRSEMPALGTDFPNLFAQGAPWADVRSHLHVLELGDQPFTRLGYSQEELTRIAAAIQTLQTRGMQLNFGITAVPVDHPVHREGLIPDTRQLDLRMQQLRRFGIHLDSVSMDTPLVNGSINHVMEHGVDLNPGYPIDETARRVERALSVVRRSYPDIKVYDAEGPRHQSLPVWKQTLRTWLAAYQQATGRKLDGMELDMNWDPGWENVIHDTCAILHAVATRCGTILDWPGYKGVTDADWNAAVLGIARQIDAAGGLGLDFVLFASWQGHPALNLPETDPSSYTGLIHDYIRQNSKSN